MADPDRILVNIQKHLIDMRDEHDMTLVTLNRLNNNLEELTDELRNIGHLLGVINRKLTRMSKGNKL